MHSSGNLGWMHHPVSLLFAIIVLAIIVALIWKALRK